MKKLVYALLICQTFIFSTNALAQSPDIFLKVQAPGYSFFGGATAAGYVDQVPVFSFSDGIAGCPVIKQNCISTYSGFNFMTKQSRAVIDFMSVQLQGKTITSADVDWVVPNGDGKFVPFKIHMEDVRVTSVQESGSAGGDNLPTVSISIQASRVAWKVITQNQDGTAGPSNTFGWDFSRNVAFNYTFPQ